jgi:UDPglucose--hexose-1-phosphate uridylyltransferase
MSHLRWNPLLGTWTIVAANRQSRPNMPKDWCPFCPGSGKVPDAYDVHLYQNDFPALSTTGTDDMPEQHGDVYRAAEAYGSCDVILYASGHQAKLYELSDEHMLKLVNLWCERHELHAADEQVKYVFPFENRGSEVGVTMPHPHGQLYAYPFVPLKVATELDNAKAHYEKTGRNLFDDMQGEELASGKRILFETQHFVVFLPYFTDYPYGLFVVAKDPVLYLTDLTVAARQELGVLLKRLVGCFDYLFAREFPYMMCMHQAPVNSPEYGDCATYYRLHIEFYPPLRNSTAVKYYASSEMGAWAATNTMAVEDAILQLRDALERFDTKYERATQA